MHTDPNVSHVATTFNMDCTNKRWWDYCALFGTKQSRYCLVCNCTVAIFGQWAGSGAIDYFIAAVLETAGVTEEIQQMNFNLGKACMQFSLTIIGAFFVDKLGRRPMLIGTFSTICVV